MSRCSMQPVRVKTKAFKGARKIVLTSSERKIAAKSKRIFPSEFAEQKIVVPMSSVPGRWRNKTAPYLAGIMDASFFSSVRKVAVCAAQQTGKSEMANVCMAYGQYYAPGPGMYVYPDELTAKDNSKDRILQIFKKSPGLRRLLTGYTDDEGMKRINLVSAPIYFAWATSPSKTANKPIKYMVMDEMDMYPTTIDKRRGAPHKEAEARTRTFSRTRKIWYISSPTTEEGVIWKLYQEAQARFHYWIPCPECGTYQKTSFKQIKWPDLKKNKLTPIDIEAKALAWYECKECGAKWNDTQKNKAVQNGEWREEETEKPLFTYLRAERPIFIAFHIPAILSQFVAISEIASQFLQAKDDPIKLRTFMNMFLAEPWKHIVKQTKKHDLLKATGPYKTQIVPPDTVALTAGIDCQKYGFWFAVRAWLQNFTSYLVHYGQLSTWDEVEKLLFDTYYPVDGMGEMLGIARAGIDTGGGTQYDSDISITEEAYNWIRSHRIGPNGCRVWGTKGASQSLSGKIRVGKPLDRTPSGKPIPGGLQIIQLDTEKFKDLFVWRLEQAMERKSMAAYLPKDVSSEYLDHITAEEKRPDSKERIRWVRVRKNNHLFDCEVIAAATADPEWPIGGINLLKKPIGLKSEFVPPTTQTKKPKTTKPTIRRLW